MKYEIKLRTHSLAAGGGGAHLRLVELEFVAEENHTPVHHRAHTTSVLPLFTLQRFPRVAVCR